MLFVRAIVRPEKKDEVLENLSAGGFHAATVVDVVGRGKQKGIRMGDVYYDEIPKTLILVAVEDKDKDKIVDIIQKNSITGENGNFGDGKIFISPVEEAYTISSGTKGL